MECLRDSGIDRKGSGQRNVLSYDMGRGTFDVSLLTIEEGQRRTQCPGTAVQGATRTGERSSQVQNLLALDVTTLSMAFETADSMIQEFFKRQRASKSMNPEEEWHDTGGSEVPC